MSCFWNFLCSDKFSKTQAWRFLQQCSRYCCSNLHDKQSPKSQQLKSTNIYFSHPWTCKSSVVLLILAVLGWACLWPVGEMWISFTCFLLWLSGAEENWGIAPIVHSSYYQSYCKIFIFILVGKVMDQEQELLGN